MIIPGFEDSYNRKMMLLTHIHENHEKQQDRAFPSVDSFKNALFSVPDLVEAHYEQVRGKSIQAHYEALRREDRRLRECVSADENFETCMARLAMQAESFNPVLDDGFEHDGGTR